MASSLLRIDRRPWRARLGAVIAGLALAGAAGPGAAQDPDVLLCSAPAEACAPTIEPICLERLSLGADAVEPVSCAYQLGAYRACLMRAVRECGGDALSPADLSQMALAEPVSLDREALFKAQSVTISLAEPPREPGLTPAEIAKTFRCRKTPGCATQYFYRYHLGQLIFDIDRRDASTGELIGWLPQSASLAGRRGRYWRRHSGEAVVSGDALVITGRVYTDGYRPHCAINLLATSPRTLAGTVTCRGLRPFEATATFEPAGGEGEG